MNMREDPKSSPAGRVSGRDVADALADVLRDQNEKAKSRLDAPSKGGKRKTSRATWAVFVVSSALLGYVWLGSPSWISTSPPLPSPAMADAGLRMEVFGQALLIEEFRETEGRLPNDLSEAGDPFSEVEYHRIDARDYRLNFAGRGGTVESASTETLATVLGNARRGIRLGG